MKVAVLLVVVIVVFVALARARKDERIEMPSEMLPGKKSGSFAESRARSTQLLTSYRLQERETGFYGDWRETTVGGTRLAFLGGAPTMDILAGEFDPDEEQLTDIYLSRVSEERPLPKRESQLLDPYVGADGRQIAQRYYLNATGAKDYPQLRIEAVREAMLALSDSVVELGILESGGVEVSVDTTTATANTVEADAKLAVEMARAIARERQPA